MSTKQMSHEGDQGHTAFMDLPPEIRFEPVGCLPEAIDRANLLEGREGECAFEPAEIAIERIRTEDSPSKARLESWAQHPDERVVMALLTSSQVNGLAARVGNEILSHIVQRAVDDARRRHEIWTPLLEALSNSIWDDVEPIQSVRDAGYSQSKYFETEVKPWIQRQTDPNVLRHVVLRTQSQELICHIARLATIVDRALMEAALNAFPLAGVPFARNGHLSTELCEFLLDQIVAAVAWDEEVCYLRKDSFVTGIYKHLAGRGLYLRPQHIDRLIRAFESRCQEADQLSETICKRVLVLLDQHVGVTGDDEIALTAIELASKLSSPYWTITLLSHSNRRDSRYRTTPRLALAALTHWNGFVAVLDAVARQPELRQNPDVRRQLLESFEPTILMELAEDDRPDEFARIFQHLAPQYPEYALDFLKRNQEVAKRTLSQTDLLPLLRTSSQEVRLETIALLGEFEADRKIETPTVSQRSS